ncbi:MAG: VWA domain-containing protein [Myxococcales bacterium]|nr:VWA domain-containing protein [Myxococcales bacterium]
MVTLLLLAALHVNTQVEHDFLSEKTGGEVYVQIDLAADAVREDAHRVPVNAVMILDRSGSMHGMKIERAREAARALVQALGPEDRFAIVDFSNRARVVVPSTAATLDAKANALALISAIQPGGGTNMSAAFDAAAPQLSEGRAHGRVDKVFVASDGQANQGISARPALLRLARQDFGAATVSTFGIGDDYDEQFMTQLAVQAGGRARYVSNGADLPQAFALEFSRAAKAVAHDVRLDVRPFKNVRVIHVVGFGAGSVRLPDIAAGEERRVLVKLAAPPGRGTAELADIELTYRDARGADQKICATALAQYTADAVKLDAQKPNQITWQAAMGEMADSAQNALRYQAANEPEMARKEQARVAQIAAQAAAAAPAPAAKKLKERATLYDARLSASGAGRQSERKALSADASEESTQAVAF